MAEGCKINVYTKYPSAPISLFLVSIRIWRRPNKSAVNAHRSPQTRYHIAYVDGFRNTECDSKSCHDHGHESRVLILIDVMKDMLKVITMARIEPATMFAGNNQRSAQNETSSINATPKSQEVPNNTNNNGVCDPTHQVCAMTDLVK